MIGRDRNTGQLLSGVAHLVQSCGDILGTRLGSRRCRPAYGSRIPEYVDMPVNAGWKSSVSAEAIRALRQWEPRLKVERVQVVSVLAGKVTCVIAGQYQGQRVEFEVSA